MKTTTTDITATEGRLNKLLTSKIQEATSTSTVQQINNIVEDSKIQAGVVEKFYAYQNRAVVKLENGKLVSCTILHHFGPDLIDLYTPIGDTYFDESIHEKYIKPRGRIYCIVSPFSLDNKDKYVLLGYFVDDDLTGANPASPGNFKILTMGGTIQYSLRFGHNGLEVVTNKTSTTIKDDFTPEYSPKYADVSDVYSKEEIDKIVSQLGSDEYYIKEEIDKLIKGKTGDVVNLSDYTVDFDLTFGLSGRDDIITVDAFLKKI